MNLSIITPVYNQHLITLDYLKNICPYLSDDMELIIVDNASTSETKQIVNLVQNQYKNIDYIRSDVNLMFGGGNNLGKHRAKSNNLLFLSNDVRLMGNECLKEFKDELKDRGEYCIFGGRHIEFESGWNKFKNKLSREILVIDYLEGWAIGITKQMCDKLKVWDERFKIDFEDMDVSYMARLNGIKLHQIKNSNQLNHLGGQTAYKLEGGRLPYTLESQKKFCDKWGLNVIK